MAQPCRWPLNPWSPPHPLLRGRALGPGGTAPLLCPTSFTFAVLSGWTNRHLVFPGRVLASFPFQCDAHLWLFLPPTVFESQVLPDFFPRLFIAAPRPHQRHRARGPPSGGSDFHGSAFRPFFRPGFCYAQWRDPVLPNQRVLVP